ncbi:MAG: serine hydrolase domain-containing protein [Bacteroidota bacterium]
MKHIYLLFLISVLMFSCNTNLGQTTSDKIDYIVKSAYKDGDFTGAVLVTDKGKVVYKNSFGMADAGHNVPVTDSTKFLIASLSKPLTAVLILRLAEQGKLGLHDKVSKYITSLDGYKSGNITIHQLLTHTSGIAEVIGEKHPFNKWDLLNNKFDFEPGTDFKYSNSGYVILKEIAQVASGKSYPELMSKEIFIPAGMSSSGIARDIKQIKNLASGYKTPHQTDAAPINYSLEIVDGAGSVYATAMDLYKFDRALASGELLSPQSVNLMLQQHVKEKYGYGWFLRERGGDWNTSYHKGNLLGYTAYISRQKTKHQCIILLANAENMELDDMERDIAKVLKSSNE